MNIKQRTLYNIKHNKKYLCIEVNKQELINNIKACTNCSRIVLTIDTENKKELIIENTDTLHTQKVYNWN